VTLLHRRGREVAAPRARSPEGARTSWPAPITGHGPPPITRRIAVDTKSETVLVFRRSEPQAASFDVALEIGIGERLASPLLPGFSLAVAELFGG
jgi:hypothetical protein